MDGKSEIELRGLVGSNPIGAMAAFGLLRICSKIQEIDAPKLLWRMEDDWFAVLKTANNLDDGKLSSLIFKYINNSKRNINDIFAESDTGDIRLKPEKMHDMLDKLVGKSTYLDREMIDYWSAFSTENAVDQAKGKGLSKPTALYMTSGNQSFAKKVRDLYDNVDEDKINEALYGVWTYGDKHEYSMGWDPTTTRTHAFRKMAPTSDTTPLCVIGAELLAFQSIPLYPVFASKGRSRTTGFVDDYFTWPIWEIPITIDILKTLIQSGEDPETKLKRGVSAIYSSHRKSVAKGYGIFEPAVPVHMKTPP
ncbi:MAG: type I-G CRISPR-associated protein, Cas3-extension family [Thermoplasmataceae archaeon]|jgi:hypothetical protein